MFVRIIQKEKTRYQMSKVCFMTQIYCQSRKNKWGESREGML